MSAERERYLEARLERVQFERQRETDRRLELESDVAALQSELEQVRAQADAAQERRRALEDRRAVRGALQLANLAGRARRWIRRRL